MIPSNAFSAITPTEITKASNLFDKLKDLRGRHSNVDVDDLHVAFEAHVRGVLEKLECRMPLFSHNDLLKQAEVSMAIHGLYDASFQQAILMCLDISPALGSSLKELRLAQASLMNDLQQVVTKYVKENAILKSDLDETISRNVNFERELEDLKNSQLHIAEGDDVSRRIILEMRHQLREAHIEIASLKDQLAFSSRSNNVGNGGARDRDDSISKQSQINSSVKATPHRSTVASTPSSAAGSRQTPLASASMSLASANGSIRSTGTASVTSVLAFPDSWLLQARAEVQRVLDSGKVRDMTLNECKDAINRLYESKAAIAKMSIKPGSSHAVMQVGTLEQHVFRSLEKKYGLKGLAVEHAAMLFAAVKRFAGEDHEVGTFQAVLNNEVEEDFYIVQEEMRKSVRDLLMLQLINRYPSKDKIQLNALLEKKMSGYLVEDEWAHIVGYLYNHSDGAAVSILLKQLAREETRRGHENQVMNGITQLPEGSLYQQLHMQQLTPAPVSAPARPRSASSARSSTASSAGSRRGASKNSVNALDLQSTHSRHSAATASEHQMSLSVQSRMGVSMRSGLGAGANGLNSSISVGSLHFDGPRISVAMFIKCLLDFQLRSRRQHLSPMRRAFNHCDADGDGVLTAAEFKECFRLLRSRQPAVASSGASSPSNRSARSGCGSWSMARSGGVPASVQSGRTPVPSGGVDLGILNSDTDRGWTAGALYSGEDEAETLVLLLKTADPLLTDKIPFSAAVTAFSKYGVV